MPSSPTEVFKRIPTNTSSFSQPTRTPPDQIALEDALLKSSPPEGTEMHQSNDTFRSIIRYANDIITPAKRYAERITRMAETLNATNILQTKQLTELKTLLQARKIYIRGKRVRLDGVAVYNIRQILAVAREKEKTPTPKQLRGRLRKRSIEKVDKESEDEILETLSMVSVIVLE